MKNQTYACDCGGSFTDKSLKRHQISKRHQNHVRQDDGPPNETCRKWNSVMWELEYYFDHDYNNNMHKYASSYHAEEVRLAHA